MAKKPTSKTKKKLKKAAVSKSTNQPGIRRIQEPKHRSFKVGRRLKHPAPKLPAARRILWRSLVNLARHRKIFGGILAIYALLSLSLVKSFSVNSGLIDFKTTLQSLVEESSSKLGNGAILLDFLINNTGPASEVAAAYLTMLLIIVSLAIIWALRQTQAGAKISIKDPFYKGLYPLVPVILVLLVVGLQTLPLIGANILFGVVFGSIAVTILEKVLWAVLFFLLALLSIYMITSSIFAFYIVTLPDVTPLQALRSARGLVRHRRWTVMRKLLFLPFVVIIGGCLILMPTILFVTVAAEWVYFVLSLSTLFIIHSYIYSLYRELLQ